jgi:hypothetical protein
MSRTVSVPRIIKIGRLTEVARIHGAGVYIHWSVLAICAVMLAGVIKRPLQSIVGLVAYLSVLLIHESGHLILARVAPLHFQDFNQRGGWRRALALRSNCHKCFRL